MTQLLERERARVAPPPVLKPPISRKPWIPWLWGFGLLLAFVAIGFAVANLFIGDEVEHYDRAAEHGDHTAFVQDLRTDLSPGYVGQDANLDPDVALQIPPMELIVGIQPVAVPVFGSGYPATYGTDSLYLPDAARQVRPIFGSGYPATYGSEGMYLPEAARQVRPIFGSGYPTTYGSEGMYLPSYTRAPPESEVDPADVKFFATTPEQLEPTIDPADVKFFANAPEPTIDPADRKFFGG